MKETIIALVINALLANIVALAARRKSARHRRISLTAIILSSAVVLAVLWSIPFSWELPLAPLTLGHVLLAAAYILGVRRHGRHDSPGPSGPAG